jgi:HEAT repeat protein
MMRAMSSFDHRLARALGVRTGEGRLAAHVALVFAVIEAGRGFGEVGVDTLVLGRFGSDVLPDVLPFLFMALGGTSLVVALVYGAALGRLPRGPLFVAILAGVAGLIVVLRLALADGSLLIVAVLWLTVYAAGMLAVTMSWTVASGSFDARQAKRLFPLLTGAAIAGSFFGTLGAGPATAIGGVEALLVIEAIMLVVAAALIARLSRRPSATARRGPRRSIVGEILAGYQFVVRSPLMRLVAVAYVLLAILMFSVSYPFLLAASAAFPTDVERATALGLLSAAVTGTSFLVSITLANRIYTRFGVTTGAVVLPVVYLAGFGLWLVSFSFATAALVRFAQQVTQRGISNAAWSAFYSTVPAERRAQVIAFNDGVPGQVGIILSGVLLLAAGRFLAADQVFWLGIATALVATGVVWAIRRRYAGSLLQALRSGGAEQVLEGGPGMAALVRDPTVVEALLAALRAPEPGVREVAVTMLGRADVPGSRHALVGALDDEDARVRAAAIGAVARSADGFAGLDLAPFTSDASPLVRAAAIVARAGPEIAPGSPLLSDTSEAVRAAALGRLRDTDPTHRITLIAALDDDAAIVRAAAATALGASSSDARDVLAVLTDGSPRSQLAALNALVGIAENDPSIRAPVAEWAFKRLGRARELRAARLAIARVTQTGEASASRDFLVSVLDRREEALEESALGALAVLGAPEARGVIRRCLGSNDPEIRAQAIEALETLADRRIAGALIRLLEDGPETAVLSADTAVRRMADDGDPWIRALARRCILDAGGDDMAATERTLSDLDTMLLLRRIPLFEGLDPEDLQRIADTSEERTFDDGETLIREGEVGHELIVLVDGSVRVVQATADGGEREIRRYAAGQHIGELAVLRERPRAATVVAAEPVRGLVISGDALKSILRERPGAAMAMLATLADRISTQ